MEILFEDKDIAVVVKAPGELSQPDEKGHRSLKDSLTEYFAAKGENSDIHVVHRLDRFTGGLMVYARNSFSAAELSKQIQNNTFVKEYLAAVHSVPENPEGTFEDLLFKDSKKNKSFVVSRERKGVKKAKLDYRLIETFESPYGCVSLVRVHLHTGRTHQIRVQFASRKLPLVGDGKYGGSDNGAGLALWSCFLSFNHPRTKEKLEFEKLNNFDELRRG